ERGRFDPVEVRRERLIERVEIGLAMDAEGACDVIEAVERAFMEIARERVRERERLLRTDLHFARPELVEERDEDRTHCVAAPQRRSPAVRAMRSYSPTASAGGIVMLPENSPRSSVASEPTRRSTVGADPPPSRKRISTVTNAQRSFAAVTLPRILSGPP